MAERSTTSIAPLFQRLTQGVYVIGVAHGEKRNAFTAAWVMQVSYDPLLLALSINPNHSSYLCYRETGAMDGASTLYPDILGRP
jgi:flavin reductase (DIM6/NTAB) family NADH-FMN oxidoreductase RutF